jgi:hypothetical protein
LYNNYISTILFTKIAPDNSTQLHSIAAREQLYELYNKQEYIKFKKLYRTKYHNKQTAKIHPTVLDTCDVIIVENDITCEFEETVEKQISTEKETITPINEETVEKPISSEKETIIQINEETVNTGETTEGPVQNNEGNDSMATSVTNCLPFIETNVIEPVNETSHDSIENYSIPDTILSIVPFSEP